MVCTLILKEKYTSDKRTVTITTKRLKCTIVYLLSVALMQQILSSSLHLLRRGFEPNSLTKPFGHLSLTRSRHTPPKLAQLTEE